MSVGLKIGTSRLYVVKDIPELLAHFRARDEAAYGKATRIVHREELLDASGRALLEMVRRHVETYDRVSRAYSASAYGYREPIKESVCLSGEEWDSFFMEHQGEELELAGGYRGSMLLRDGDPAVHLRVEEKKDAVSLSFGRSLPGIMCRTADRLYVLEDEGVLRRCSPGFSRAMRELLKAVSGGAMLLLRDDLPAFCGCVLPAIAPYCVIEDEKGLLEGYAPEPCTPIFRFDQVDRQTLKVTVRFRYGDREVRRAEKVPGLRRDERAESAACRLVEKRVGYMTEDGTARDWCTEDELAQFLTEGVRAFQSLGEVYLSDRLQGMELRPGTGSVGLSVSDGLLELELDAGGFPLEELEELYQSLLLRRKYHRLRDGRFMVLSGTGAEKAAEVAHMTQLDADALKTGHATLPVYRAMYLDNVLTGSEGLRVDRDSAFRDMVRRFKTYADSDDQVPASLKGVLRPYQETGFRWLRMLQHCGFGGILADEMGLGKTLQTIACILADREEAAGRPSLVVCPASLVLNWQDELTRFAPALAVRTVLGAQAARRALIEDETPADVWVTSYDLLKRDIESYRGKRFRIGVFDEAQMVKNSRTKASKAVKELACDQRFVLTGTPIENRLSELWNLFDLLMPGYLFSHERFVERIEKPVTLSGDPEARARLAKLVQPFLLRRLKKDVLKELPPKLEHVHRIALGEEERKVYHAYAMKAADELRGSGEKLQILAALTRLRQICCDPALCFENYEGESSKLEACVELVQSMTENGHQVLLFSQFTSMLERIRERLDKAGITHYTLEGSTSKERRAALVKSFNAGGAQVFLISLKAGGTGLNLTAADVVIHYDPWWNRAAQDQATDRAHRIGQQSCVQVYQLIAQDTIEEKICRLQEKKAGLLDAVTEGDGTSLLSMSADELLELIEDR